MIVLLDLNYTLAENSDEVRRHGGEKFADRVSREVYRQWLIDLIRPHTVLLCTARTSVYRQVTLARIRAVTGWLPDESYFNDRDQSPPEAKERYLMDMIFKRYGLPSEVKYLALDSNPRTRAMYKRHGIEAYSVGEVETWRALLTM